MKWKIETEMEKEREREEWILSLRAFQFQRSNLHRQTSLNTDPSKNFNMGSKIALAVMVSTSLDIKLDPILFLKKNSDIK